MGEKEDVAFPDFLLRVRDPSLRLKNGYRQDDALRNEKLLKLKLQTN
jgi:hypothetical protein